MSRLKDGVPSECLGRALSTLDELLGQLSDPGFNLDEESHADVLSFLKGLGRLEALTQRVWETLRELHAGKMSAELAYRKQVEETHRHPSDDAHAQILAHGEGVTP